MVLPGVALTRASPGRPIKALSRLDLPTLDRPIKAISGSGGSSRTSGSGKEPTNSTPIPWRGFGGTAPVIATPRR